MRLVDVAEFYTPHGGGVRTVIEQKLLHADALGHEAIVLAPGPRDQIERRGRSQIITIASPPEPLDPRYHRFRDPAPVHAWLHRLCPDVVEASSLWAGARIVKAWRGPALKSLVVHQEPVAVYAHTLFDWALAPGAIDQLARPFWSRVSRLATGFGTVVVPSQWLAGRLRQAAIAAPAVLPFGIDGQHFHPDLRCEATRRALLGRCGLSDTPAAQLLVALSRHHPEKRLGTLFGAIERINTQRPVGLVVVGEGPWHRVVHWQARSCPQVHLMGPVRDRARLAQLLASADGFLHGGAAETFGLAVGEALMSGLPIVVPSSGAAADMLQPAWGEAYAAGSAEACAAAIMRLLDRDRAALSLAARAAGVRFATPRDHVAALIAHYHHCLTSPQTVRVAA